MRKKRAQKYLMMFAISEKHTCAVDIDVNFRGFYTYVPVYKMQIRLYFYISGLLTFTDAQIRCNQFSILVTKLINNIILQNPDIGNCI